MRRRDLGLGCLLGLTLPTILSRAADAAAPRLRIGKQYGLPYLSMMVMEAQKLIEKHAARQGLGTVEIAWQTLGGTSALNDLLLSGQLDFVVVGVPALATLRDKTAGTPQEVRALSAVQSMPFVLVTRNEAIRDIGDFTERDRIALPAVKISAQAVALEMAAAGRWGFEHYEKLDPLTVTLPHPDAVAALLSGRSEVDSHYGVAPFQYYELANPSLHAVLKSYDTLGGPHTNGVLIGTKRFRDANPELCTVLLRAQEEANAFIRAEPRRAAETYRAMAHDTRNSTDEIARMLADPDIDYTTTPRQVMKFVAFMHAVGRLKALPASWKDLFFPEAQGLAGS